MSVMKLEQFCHENGIEPEDLDEVVHNLKGEEAAVINNGGMEHQLQFILMKMGINAALDQLGSVAEELR